LRETMADWTADTMHADRVKMGERVDGQDIKLIKGGLITGRVTSLDSGEAVPGVTIFVAPKDTRSFWLRFSTSDVEGRYRLRVPAGEKHVYLGGQVPDAFSGSEKDGDDPTVTDGATATVNFRLRSIAATDYVSGQVVDRAGRPAAKARVVALPVNGSFRRSPEAFSGEDGRFRNQLPEAEGRTDKTTPRGARLLASQPRGGATIQPVEVRGGQTATLTLDPAGLASIEGKVTDQTGHPVGHAQILVSQELGDIFQDDPGHIETDAAGHFHVVDLWPI